MKVEVLVVAVDGSQSIEEMELPDEMFRQE